MQPRPNVYRGGGVLYRKRHPRKSPSGPLSITMSQKLQRCPILIERLIILRIDKRVIRKSESKTLVRFSYHLSSRLRWDTPVFSQVGRQHLQLVRIASHPLPNSSRMGGCVWHAMRRNSCNLRLCCLRNCTTPAPRGRWASASQCLPRIFRIWRR